MRQWLFVSVLLLLLVTKLYQRGGRVRLRASKSHCVKAAWDTAVVEVLGAQITRDSGRGFSEALHMMA